GRRYWGCNRTRAHASDDDVAVRNYAERYRHLCGCFRVLDFDSSARLLSAGATGNEGRSVGSAEVRVEEEEFRISGRGISDFELRISDFVLRRAVDFGS